MSALPRGPNLSIKLLQAELDQLGRVRRLLVDHGLAQDTLTAAVRWAIQRAEAELTSPATRPVRPARTAKSISKKSSKSA
jgi:hypothetical protein